MLVLQLAPRARRSTCGQLRPLLPQSGHSIGRPAGGPTGAFAPQKNSQCELWSWVGLTPPQKKTRGRALAQRGLLLFTCSLSSNLHPELSYTESVFSAHQHRFNGPALYAKTKSKKHQDPPHRLAVQEAVAMGGASRRLKGGGNLCGQWPDPKKSTQPNFSMAGRVIKRKKCIGNILKSLTPAAYSFW
jgi:hypothetical protein